MLNFILAPRFPLPSFSLLPLFLKWRWPIGALLVFIGLIHDLTIPHIEDIAAVEHLLHAFFVITVGGSLCLTVIVLHCSLTKSSSRGLSFLWGCLQAKISRLNNWTWLELGFTRIWIRCCFLQVFHFYHYCLRRHSWSFITILNDPWTIPFRVFISYLMIIWRVSKADWFNLLNTFSLHE